MPLIINGQPASVPSLDLASASTRVVPTAQLSPLSAVARVQLPVAVAASGLAQAYSPNTPTPPKPVLRTVNTAPSKPLAAQLIAQSPDISAQELQIFVTRQPVNEEAKEAGEAEYLNDLRIARGDAPRPGSAATPEKPTATAASTLPAPTAATLAQAAPILVNTSAVPRLSKQILAVLTPLGKKPGLGNARGADAYRVAESRNFTSSFPASVSAVL